MSKHNFPPNLLFPSSLSNNSSHPTIIQNANKILEAAMRPVEIPINRQHDWSGITKERTILRDRHDSPFSARVQSILDAAAQVAKATDTHKLYKAVSQHGATMLDHRPERQEQDDRSTIVTLFLIDPLDDDRLISETTTTMFKIGEGIIGHVAATKQVLNMAIGDLPDHPTNHLNPRKPDDAFNPAEFWMSFEGDPTKDVLCCPIIEEPTGDDAPVVVLGVLHAERPSIRAHFRRQKSREGTGRRRSPKKKGGNRGVESSKTSKSKKKEEDNTAAAAARKSATAKNRARKPPFAVDLEEALVQLARLVAAAVIQSNADAGDNFAKQARKFRNQKNMRRVLKVLERGTREAKANKFNTIKDQLFRAEEMNEKLERAVEEEQKNLIAMNKLLDVVKEEKVDIDNEKRKISREFDLLSAKNKMEEIENSKKTAKILSLERSNEMYKEQLKNYHHPKDLTEIERLTKLTYQMTSEFSNQEHQMKMERAKRLMARFVMREISSAFQGWKTTVKEIKRQKKEMKRIVSRIMNRCLAWTLDGWIEYVEEEKRLRGLLNRAARAMKNRQVSGAFNSWIEFVDLRNFMKEFVRKMIGRYEKKEIAKGLGKWIQVFNDERRAEFEMDNNRSRSKFCALQ